MISLTVLLILGKIILYFRIKKLSEGTFDPFHNNIPFWQSMIFVLLSIILVSILIPTIIHLITKYLP